MGTGGSVVWELQVMWSGLVVHGTGIEEAGKE
jgi:hypothetical protein